MDFEEMDSRKTIDLIGSIRRVAVDGSLHRNFNMRDDVLTLKNHSEFQCKMDREEFGPAYATAAQAWLLVSGACSPGWVDSIHERVVEYAEIALDRLSVTNAMAP